MKLFHFTAVAVCLAFAACSKTKTPDFQAGDSGSVDIEFDNIVGATDLQLNTGVYTDSKGEKYSISTFRYYISNIILKNIDGSFYTVPRDSSYFLISEEDPSQLITINHVPAGNYNGISFTIGVDSLKCTEPIANRTGDLDPAGAAADMYWTWNSGYIFLKMEGTSTVLPADMNTFEYHIGGFGGYSSPTINNIKKVTLAAPSGMQAEVRKNKAENPHMHLFADAAKLLDGKTAVSIAENPMVMFSPFSVNIANNYATMFTIDHIHND